MPRRSKSWFDRRLSLHEAVNHLLMSVQWRPVFSPTVDTNQVDLVHGEGSQSPEVPRARELAPARTAMRAIKNRRSTEVSQGPAQGGGPAAAPVPET